MMRALNMTYIDKIRSRIDKDQVLNVKIGETNYNMILTSFPKHKLDSF